MPQRATSRGSLEQRAPPRHPAQLRQNNPAPPRVHRNHPPPILRKSLPMKKCDPRKARNLVACAIALSAAVVETPARAQAEDQAAARSLFDDGRRLLKEGQYAEACPKLEAASKLFTSPGILLNLADCYEKVGRSASAWAEFSEAASVAARAKRPEQVKEAKRRQSALEPKLTRLTVRVANEVPGLQIKRDLSDLASGVWGVAVPVDPGPHEIRAEAPGREAWSTTVTVAKPGETATVEVPELRPLPVAAPTLPAARQSEPAPIVAVTPAETTHTESRSHVVDWALIGAGAALGIAGGVVMGIEAQRAHDARAADTSPAASSQAIADYNSTKTPYYAGVVGVIVGGAAATAGLLMLTMWQESPRSTGLHVSPWIGVASSGIGMHGAW
jgi:hypothetical protein